VNMYAESRSTTAFQRCIYHNETRYCFANMQHDISNTKNKVPYFDIECKKIAMIHARSE